MYTDKLKIAASQNIKERDYWLKKLAGELTETVFPPDRSQRTAGTPISPEKEYETAVFSFTAELASRLTTLSSGSDYTLHIILAAGLTLLLNKYTGNNDIIMGTPVYRQPVEKTLVNTLLILRNTINAGDTFKDLLLRVRQNVVEATENYNYPVEILLEQLGIPFDGNKIPFLGTAILLENIHDAKYLRDMKPAVVFYFRREDDRIRGEVKYKPLLYNKTTIRRIIHHFKNLLRQVVFEPGKSFGQIEIISEAEKQQLLIEFNHICLPSVDVYPGNKTLQQLFEEQAQQTPDNTAVVGPSQTDYRTYRTYTTYISYRELNAKSNQLARLLRARGVKTDTTVGIMVERGVEMITGILGILKAGGAYLPIDPQTPGKRIVSLLRDSNSRVLLTHGTALNRHSYALLQDHHDAVTPVLTRPRSQVTNLDGLPIPDRSLVDYESYHCYIGQAMVKNSIALQATRGCPFKCVYCHKIWPKHHVFRTAEHIFEEVQLYYNMGVRRFVFIDDIFNLNIKNSRQFFHLILENQLDVQLFFPNGLRGDILTKAYIDLMVEAGTVNLALALETASPRLQKKIGKNLDLEKLEENIVYFCQKYPQVILELFTIHGFPSETEEEALMTLDFINRLKWTHFPYVFVLKIYPNTDMAKMAIENGVAEETIAASESLAYHELPTTLPFAKSFTLKYQAAFLNDYFLSKERLLHVLPYQMNTLTADEMVQKYNSYLPAKITQIHDLLALVNITGDELGVNCFQGDDALVVPGFNRKLKNHFNKKEREAAGKGFKVLLLDLSQFFSSDKGDMLYDVVEPPLGLMYLATYLHREMGSNVTCKVAKSRIDFDSFQQLKKLLEIFNPDVIGIRTLTFYKDFFHQSVGMIRQWGIEVPIIAGGPYATSDYRRALSDKNIDVIVLGEGEVTFCELVEAIMTRGGQLPGPGVLKEIPGLAFIPHKKEFTRRFAREIIMLDTLDEELSREPARNPEHINPPGDLAYVIYTSGSTGKPKGVMLEHQNVNYLLNGLKKRIYENYDRYLQVGLLSPYVFDASVKQVFLALVQGHCLHIIPKETREDGAALLDFYRKYRLDISDATPTHIRILLEIMEGTTAGFSIDRFIVGGESLSRKTVEEFLSRFEKQGNNIPRITNVYGPTECCVDAATYEVTGEDIAGFENIPIGKPMPNARVYILGRENQLQPIGTAGELCIAGNGVGRGYLNNPELTSEKFDHDLWDSWDYRDKRKKIPDKRINMSYRSYKSYVLYRTGDLGRWLADGNIEFLGRIDHQVKIRGYRIELGEIENRMMKYPPVKVAVVVVKKDKTGDKYLCAYFVPREPGEPGETSRNQSGIREYLARELPAYVIPSFFVQLEKIPLTPNGKINRNALPEPGIGDAGEGYAAPQNDCQEKLAEIWSDILGVEKKKIGIDTSFFEIGGHSLKATILIGRIHRTFDVKITLAAIFKEPTIRAIANIISQSGKNRFIQLVKVEEKEYYPLSFNQKRLWIIHRMDPVSTAYNMQGSVVMRYKAEEKQIHKTLSRLIERHESFRTGFKMFADEPVQLVIKEVKIPFRTIDISHLAEGEKKQERDRIYRKEAETPFDLSCPPIFRSVLIKLAEEHYEFVYNLHHIITDGWSNTILRREFFQMYQGYRTGIEVQPEPFLLQYKDFSQWHNKQLTDGALREKFHRYWREKMEKGLPPLKLRKDGQPGSENLESANCRLTLNREITERLKTLASDYKTSIFVVLFSVFSMLLSRLSGQQEVVTAILGAGREHASLHGIVGFFVNTLIVKIHVDGEERFPDFLGQVNENIMEMMQHQDYPLDLVFEDLKMRFPDISTLFNMFSLNEWTAEQEIDTPGAFHIQPHLHAKFEIAVHINQYKNGLEIVCQYMKALFKKERIEYMMQRYLSLLNGVANNHFKKLEQYLFKKREKKLQVKMN